MQSVAKLMKEYFGAPRSEFRQFEGYLPKPPGILQEQRLPLVPTEVKWEVLEGPERFVRKLRFDDRRRLVDFVNEILSYEDEVKHHGEVRVAADTVEIIVYTHTVEQITELDREYIRAVDKILRDVLDYRYEE